jgi:RNA-binding protein YhbY
MAKSKSSIVKLDPRVRDAVDTAVREGRASIDDIVLLIKSYGATVSRSSVGRYVKNASEQLQRYREAQEVAKVWIGKLNEEPEGDVARLLSEMLRTVAFQQIGEMSQAEGKDKPKPMDIMLVAKALEHLSKSQKTDVDRAVKIRDEFAKQAADAAAQVGKSKGLSSATIEEIKRSILGIK